MIAVALIGPVPTDLALSVPMAHAGHWLMWVLYSLPALIVIVSVVSSIRRGNAEAADPDADDAPGDPS